METKFMYAEAVWVNKEETAAFIEKVKPQEAFVVEDMGECYALSFSCVEDLERALNAIDAK